MEAYKILLCFFLPLALIIFNFITRMISLRRHGISVPLNPQIDYIQRHRQICTQANFYSFVVLSINASVDAIV